jgi:hypothetical protein
VFLHSVNPTSKEAAGTWLIDLHCFAPFVMMSWQNTLLIASRSHDDLIRFWRTCASMVEENTAWEMAQELDGRTRPWKKGQRAFAPHGWQALERERKENTV